jgi:hypothetical protein
VAAVAIGRHAHLQGRVVVPDGVPAAMTASAQRRIFCTARRAAGPLIHCE